MHTHIIPPGGKICTYQTIVKTVAHVRVKASLRYWYTLTCAIRILEIPGHVVTKHKMHLESNPRVGLHAVAGL